MIYAYIKGTYSRWKIELHLNGKVYVEYFDNDSDELKFYWRVAALSDYNSCKVQFYA